MDPEAQASLTSDQSPAGRSSIATTGQRSVAVVQGLGALLGVYAALMTWPEEPLDMPALAVAPTPLLVLAFVAWQAVELWRGNPAARRRMVWLLAAQIPSFSLKGTVNVEFTWLREGMLAFRPNYDCFLLFKLAIRFGAGDEPLEIGFGSKLQAFADAVTEPNFLGINLAAVALLACLRGTSARGFHGDARPGRTMQS
jgi:hypothetical protein